MRNRNYTNPCFHCVHGRVSSIPGSIARVTARVDWKDQGWGDISAAIMLVKVDAKGNTSKHTIFRMKSHRRETLTFDTNTNGGLDFFKTFKKGDGLQLWYNVGGSGHELYVYDLKVTVMYASSSSSAPPAKNQVTINVGQSTTNKVITHFNRPLSTGTYFIRSVSFGTNVRFGSNKDVDMTNDRGSYEQIEVKHLGSSKYSIKSKAHDNMFLRIPGSGANVSAITQTGVGSQEQFYIEKQDRNKYAIKSVKFGNYLRGLKNEGGDVITQTIVGSEEQFDFVPVSPPPFKNQVTINVGSSETNNKVITLPRPHMIVSPKAINAQHPDSKETFDVAVVGNKLYVSRSDENKGWGQHLQLGAVPDPIWNKTVNVGSSSSNSKRIRLPELNMDVSSYPVNRQEPDWNNTFMVDVNGYYATVTRLDSNGGWEQNLTLYCRKLGKWESGVDIVYGPDAYHIYTPGERVKFNMAAIPQNKLTGATTQIYAYIGLKGSRNKQFFELYDGVPGKSPRAFTKDIEYVVPPFPKNLAKNDGCVLEIGYGSNLQLSMANAKKNWIDRGQTRNALDYLPVEVPPNRKDSFKCEILQKFPTHAVADERLTFDVSYRPQDHYPDAISQMFVYFRDEAGGVDVCKLPDIVTGYNPPTQRGGVSYLVPDIAPGKKIEVGVYFDLQDKFEDAVNNFKRKGMKGSKVFGSFTTISSTDPKAEYIRKLYKNGIQTSNENHPKLQRAIENKISSEWYDVLKKEGEKFAKIVKENFVKYGAKKIVAATADDATLLITKKEGRVERQLRKMAEIMFSGNKPNGFEIGYGLLLNVFRKKVVTNPGKYTDPNGDHELAHLYNRLKKQYGPGDRGPYLKS
jgi:hypothetical protein